MLRSATQVVNRGSDRIQNVSKVAHFDRISDHLWKHGRTEEALDVTLQRGIALSLNPTVLQGCTKKRDLKFVLRIRSCLIQNGIDSVAILGDYIIRFFASCGCLIEVNQTFNRIGEPSIYTWTAIISSQTLLQHVQTAILLHGRMPALGMTMDEFIFLSLLKMCTLMLDLHKGRLIHEQIILNGLLSDVYLGSTLVDMYAKCSSLEEAQNVFENLPNRNVVSWGAMIGGYSQNEEVHLALECFYNMHYWGIEPDRATLLGILKACASIGALEHGRHIHEQIFTSRLKLDIHVGTALVDMYAKCGDLREACSIFNSLKNPNVVSWSVMIAGYAQHGEGLLALECFDNMQLEGTVADRVILLSTLKACSNVGAIVQGRSIHEQILQTTTQVDIIMWSTLVDMYAKCGNMEEACIVFHKSLKHDVVLWGTVIAGYAQLGDATFAIQWFEQMHKSGIQPDDTIFTGILSVCSRAGLVDEGQRYFRSITQSHRVTPKVVHYNCMIDLLGRAGHFDEAENINRSLRQPNITGWTSLLSASKMHGNFSLARECFGKVGILDSCSAPGYVLMSHIYAKPT